MEGYDDPEKSMVDHLTGNRNDNSAANLEYVTPSQSNRRAVAMGYRGRATGEGLFRHRLSPRL